MYKDLSLKEKSELFKLMVSNGITDINEIEKIYNKYNNGGNKISVNNLPESEQYAVTTPDGQRKVFNNKEEAQAYITANTLKGYSLYDTTNYASNIDRQQTERLAKADQAWMDRYSSSRQKIEDANENAKTMFRETMGIVPFVGEGLDLLDVYKETQQGNYLNAGIGAGLMALPNVIEKPLKYIGKGVKKLFNKTIKSSKDINTKNLQNITDAEWDKLYNKAIKNNDLEEAQKLRDLHFKSKAPDTKILDEYGDLQTIYTGVPVKFTKYDKSKFGSSTDEGYYGVGLYGSGDKKHAQIYAKDKNEDYILPLYINMKKPFAAGVYDKNGNFFESRNEANIRSMLAQYFNRGYKGIIDNSNIAKKDYITTNYSVSDEIKNDFIMADGVIYSNPNKRYDEVVIPEPEQMKFTYPITYDDNGNIIPLSKRDDFTNQDMRYNWLLPTIGIGTGLSLINNNENNQYKYGGAINKFSGVSNETKQEKEIIYPDIVSKNRELWNKEMERRKSRGEDARKKQQKRKSYAEEAHKIMGILNSFAERDLQLKNSIQKSIRDAINEQQEQQREKHYNNKLFLNSLATAAELGSAAWMLGKGAKALGILPNRVASSGLYSSDTPQIVSGIAGTLADSYQAATATTPKDIIENSIELPFDMAGIIGGTNVFRNTPFFGRYGNAIDNVLDGAGYIAAGYDGIIKPTSWILSQFNNGVTPEEVSIMLPEVTVVGNKKSRGGLINKYDGTSTKTQQMQTVEKPAFFEGDTWKPQYWFSPEYENATLKGAITQAYEDGNYGKDIIWNGRAYKAILNEEDANEYRKKKGIPLGEPIVNTANIQTNEKQPREYVSNSYIPVTNGNKIYYWDSYSGKFFEDAKGKTPTSKDYNTLLKDYYDQNISPALKENRYEDLIKLYVQQFRNLQARRRVSAREQDIPNDYGKRTIPITTGRSGSSRLPYPTDLIDSLSNHLQEGQSIYQALALPYKETEFGNRVNFESDVMGNRGHVLATLNDERYELPDQTFYSGLSYPLRAYFRNNKVDGKVDGMTQENFVKHYLASSENDLLDLKNLFNNKELLKYVGETLKKDLTKSRFVSFMNTNTEDNPNIYEHALSLLASGKYNPGEPGYNKGINKIAKQLENDPELNNYIDKHKIKKVGEKKK